MNALHAAARTIINADATMRTLCGRTSGLYRRWRARGKSPLPVVLGLVVTDRETGQAGQHREVDFQLSCVAAGDGAATLVDDMEARLRVLLTQNAFLAAGIDAAPVLRRTQDVDEEDDAQLAGVRTARKDLELTLNVKLA